MTIAQSTAADVAVILSHRHDQGADWWTTPDRKLLKGAPFTTLESALYLMELGVTPQHEALEAVAQLIFDAWREDGRIKTAPSGGLYPCHTALAANVLCRMGYGNDARVKRTLAYFLDTQQPDGGWRCEKYSFGHGEETQYSTPYTTLVVLDLFRRFLALRMTFGWIVRWRSFWRTGSSAAPSAHATTASARVSCRWSIPCGAMVCFTMCTCSPSMRGRATTSGFRPRWRR